MISDIDTMTLNHFHLFDKNVFLSLCFKFYSFFQLVRKWRVYKSDPEIGNRPLLSDNAITQLGFIF